MKKLFTILAAVLITASVFLPQQAGAQAPQKMTYQAVVRDDNSTLITSTQVGIEINIYQTTTSGILVYTETQTPTTNINGLLNIEIGGQTGFDLIDWANGPYFIETNIDVAGGTNYTITGVSQLLTVPYALHAKTAETITGGITEVDPVFTSSQANNITAQNITDLGNLSGVNTGDQDISGIAINTQAIQDTASQIRADIPDVSGFLTAETDPVFTSSEANNITAQNITDLGNLSGTNTGDQDLSTLATKTALADSTAQVRSEIPDVSSFLSTETDPVYTTSEAANITATDITNLGNLSGTNTGDQDLSTLATKTALADSTAQVRSEIPDVSGFLSAETDPVFTSSEANNITAQNITDLGNLSGTNTGDQDLSTLATKTALADSTALVRSEIPDVSGFLTAETDPVFTSSEANNITAQNITDLGNLSGINTGDQDISGIAINTQAIQDTASQIRADIPDVSGFVSTETDPVFTSSEANNITATDISNLGNLSGTNTGDQTISRTGLTVTLSDGGTYQDSINTYTAGTGINIANNVISSSSATTYSVGDFAQGGIVFWVDETGEHGLVCAKSDQNGGSRVRWYAGTYGVTQAKGDGPYAGEANTAIIIVAQVAIGDDNTTYAARICNELQITENGKTYGDWYFPSKQELNLMYQNKATINATATANNGSDFTGSGMMSAAYWSSTENGSNSAWAQDFNTDFQGNLGKANTAYVRAIRAF